ncbi:DUF3298 and DUF4163 domain-containing protein [uncultured Clostridium sp.]|uniref:DUF3298 and DUF4163 domain-containing protein n=1 Tax=uncultured Clostridium sp. TaxID=59620 RepID=UPI0025EBE911|nr:DUF3298 and DUF4163 domain-containing protein [uncultured Clostridium sp.]
MKLLTVFAGIAAISSMLYTGYKQNMYITCELYFNDNVNIVEKSINKDLKYLKEDLKIPQFDDGKDSSKLIDANTKINNDILPKVSEAEKSAQEYYGDKNEGKPEFPFEIYSRYTVTQNNDSIMSLYNDYYEFLGGAHGMTTRTSYTIEKESGRILELKDLFVSGYDYRSVINNEIKKQIAGEPDKYFESAEKFKGIDEKHTYFIRGDDLVIYYELYDIAPYVAGIPEFNIPLEKFNSSYKYVIAKA